MKESNAKQYILVKGARVHNLKNVDVAIPRNKLVVVTGVSGSGKSSLSIDTIFAEGQRRYVESLSSYARQFLNRINKPDVDYIKGICPAIAIEQKVVSRSSRSTVGSLTEIYDYLRLFFARVGKTYSPISGKEVKKLEVSDMVDYILKMKQGTKLQILAPIIESSRSMSKELDLLLQKGFSRLWIEGKVHRIEDLKAKDYKKKELLLLVDRIAVDKKDEDQAKRLADSLQTALYEGEGKCSVEVIGGKTREFTGNFELDGMLFHEPTPQFFSYNSPFGACQTCEGWGTVIGIDENLVIPDPSLSVYEEAIACWKGEKMKEYKEQLIYAADEFDFPIHRPIAELSKEQYELLWEGNEHFTGLHDFFRYLETKGYKIQYRVMLSRYRGRTKCRDCGGSRLRKETQYVKVNGININDIILSPIEENLKLLKSLKLDKTEKEIAKQILPEIINRLEFMMMVGLGYLTLNRLSSTLSGGETQRINLTRILGSNLTNSLYVLDEPSIGLHPRDTEKLIAVLYRLRDLGNTVLVVEHEEEIMKAADHLIDMGPKAGVHGGELVFAGKAKDIKKVKESLTAKYLYGKMSIEVPTQRRSSANKIYLKGASQHNLKNIDLEIPLNSLITVSGVSGSGKTSLIKHVLYPALKRAIEMTGNAPGKFSSLTGNLQAIAQVEMIDQNPLGKSSRSNPVTYIKAYDVIRDLYASQNLSRIRGYKAKHFSFNVPGGRCENCQGEGSTTIEMQFLADIHLECEECQGQKFKQDVLEVQYKGKNIYEVLEMSVSEAIEFFSEAKDVVKRIQPLEDVGLGYVKLGQSSSTLSGGEAQRVKLAFFLAKGSSSKKVFFIFDEPTTGLHFDDVRILLHALNALVEKGHTVLVIEHDPDVIKAADYVIDLGPEGGDKGGQLLYQGPPEGLLKVKASHTAKYLKEKLVPRAQSSG